MNTPSQYKRTAGYQPYTHYDTAMERSVLAACVEVDGVFGSTHGLLTEDCFYHADNKQVYKAMHTLWQQGSPIDMLLVAQHFYSKGITQLGGINVAQYLLLLDDAKHNRAHLQQWCLMLRELAARRTLVTLTSSGLPNDDILVSATQLQQSISKAIDIHTADDWATAQQTAQQVQQHMADAQQEKEQGISTTIKRIDDLNGGFRAGQLVVLGARPSVGKSALAGSIALAAAKQGHKVGFLSLEMPGRDILMRMISIESEMAFQRIDNGKCEPRVQQAIESVSQLPLYFSDGGSMTIHDIRAKAEQLHRTHGLDLLILDYLQLVDEVDTRSRSREQGVSQISRGLKTLAMQLQIPVIALSQLNRESEHRNNKRPTLADLRESGAIEQDADIVLLLHRDHRSGILTDSTGHCTKEQADLTVAKWRNGITHDVKLHFNPALMLFSV
jgi:replicative DNA helicase